MSCLFILSCFPSLSSNLSPLQLNWFNNTKDRALLITDKHIYRLEPKKHFKVQKRIALDTVSVSHPRTLCWQALLHRFADTKRVLSLFGLVFVLCNHSMWVSPSVCCCHCCISLLDLIANRIACPLLFALGFMTVLRPGQVRALILCMISDDSHNSVHLTYILSRFLMQDESGIWSRIAELWSEPPPITTAYTHIQFAFYQDLYVIHIFSGNKIRCPRERDNKNMTEQNKLHYNTVAKQLLFNILFLTNYILRFRFLWCLHVLWTSV